MKRYLLLLCAVAAFTLATGDAMAESIKGMVGVTGRLGLFIPAGGGQVGTGVVVDTDVGFIGGGGFIYGIDDNWAAELDITHAEFDSDLGVNHGDFATTNVALGVQYRFTNLPVPKLVPYSAVGLDILVNDFDFSNGPTTSVDTVVGGHLTAGVDYFFRRDLALTGEIKGVLAPDADVKLNGNRIADYDPSGVALTVGVRYFFN